MLCLCVLLRACVFGVWFIVRWSMICLVVCVCCLCELFAVCVCCACVDCELVRDGVWYVFFLFVECCVCLCLV